MTTRSGYTSHADAAHAAQDLADQFQGLEVRGLRFFCSHEHDGTALSLALRARFPDAEVVGCTTAGEFVGRRGGTGGAVAIAITSDMANACYGAMARLENGVDVAVTAAGRAIEHRAGIDLRNADPSRYVGIVLIDGLHMYEEQVNWALGQVAPLVTFVGGSAGDNLQFKETRVFYNGECSAAGAVLLLLDLRVPFSVVKTCSFRPTDQVFTVTRADTPHRVVYELDHQPVLQAYARAAGVAPAELDKNVFMKNPLGLMLDDQPWIRSPLAAQADGGLKFYCQIVEGTRVHLMHSTDLVAETRTAIGQGAQQLGRPIRAAIVFNCILRRLELDAAQTHDSFLEIFAGFPTAGFHTYGESYLGHINQTCTALLFG